MRFGAMFGVGLGVAFTLAVASPAVAAEQAYTNIIAGSPIYDGLMGNIGQLTDPATVVGVGYVHATQADVGPSGGDFVAIGTANGLGVGGTGCANDYDAAWSGYYDGVVGGMYFCDDFAQDAFAVGSFPTFKIEHASCAGGQVIWNLWLSGTLRSCQFMGVNAASRVITMLETTGASNTDRNIDVRFINLKWNLTGSSTWNNYGNPGGGVHLDPNYSYTYGSVTSHWIFLAPLD